MHFRTVSDLFSAVRQNKHKIPTTVDLVVGVPRSGMIAATAVSLALHKPMIDLHGYLEGRHYPSLSARHAISISAKPRAVLIVDDSIMDGGAMRRVREMVRESNTQDTIIYSAIFGHKPAHEEVDFVFDSCPAPRVFEWNVLNHSALDVSCLDLDGVLCCDPDANENDDGPRYLDFINEARVLNAPKYTINSIVTSRLEKYRPQTEEWLRRNGISYKNLIMLDATAEQRRRLSLHASFKAGVYRELTDCTLFVESDTYQAQTINELTGKSALAFQEMVFFGEGISRKTLGSAKRRLGRVLPSRMKHALKSIIAKRR